MVSYGRGLEIKNLQFFFLPRHLNLFSSMKMLVWLKRQKVSKKAHRNVRTIQEMILLMCVRESV